MFNVSILIMHLTPCRSKKDPSDCPALFISFSSAKDPTYATRCPGKQVPERNAHTHAHTLTKIHSLHCSLAKCFACVLSVFAPPPWSEGGGTQGTLNLTGTPAGPGRGPRRGPGRGPRRGRGRGPRRGRGRGSPLRCVNGISTPLTCVHIPVCTRHCAMYVL
jgi:hypothetical protein